MTPPAYLNPRIPKIEYKPNTSILDVSTSNATQILNLLTVIAVFQASQYSILTKQACGLSLTTRKLFNRQSNVSQMLLNREVRKRRSLVFTSISFRSLFPEGNVQEHDLFILAKM